jgi:hypothetical protein
MKYTVLVSDEFVFLEEKVNLYLAAGWKVLGGVSVSMLNDDMACEQVCAQAMVHRDSNPDYPLWIRKENN